MSKSETKKTVLIIDDSPAILRVFSRILRKKGFLVTTAATGREAWEKLKTKSYDAALIDVRLPEMNGTDLLPRMGKLAPKMVKIVFTGFPLEEKSIEAIKTNADALISKPAKPETILSILEEKMKTKKIATNNKA